MGQDATLETLTVESHRGPRRVAPAAAHLRVVHPRDLRAASPLAAERVLVGRRPSTFDSVIVPHRTVSREHLEISATGTGPARYRVRDLGSRNGVWVDGERAGVAGHPLSDGSVLRLGDVLAVLELGGGAAPPGAERVHDDAVFGLAPAVDRVRAELLQAAPDPSSALVLGETGTGKERVARALHELSGRKGPVVALSCAELSPQLVESQLFGHVQGAFTGAAGSSQGLFRAAHGGTLVLDEIGELPMDLQAKLLRVLEDHQVRPVGGTKSTRVDVRVVASTNRELASLVEEGGFRRDLYARLAYWEIRLPPLRERRGDIPSWVDRLYEVWCRTRGLDVTDLELEVEAAQALLLHPWPDNLRGLDRLVHRLAGRGQGAAAARLDEIAGVVSADAAPPPPSPPPARPARRPTPSRDELVAAMEQHEGSVRAVARHFGRDRRQIYRWLDAFGLRGKQGASPDEG